MLQKQKKGESSDEEEEEEEEKTEKLWSLYLINYNHISSFGIALYR